MRVYAGTDPLTGKEIRLKATAKTAEHAQAELARLLEQASVGQQPELAATVGYLLDQYMAVADLDVSTREGYEGYIRRTIKPALGGMELRKLRGPVLDTFYARLRRCGDLACTGRPFTEHHNVPVLTVDPGDPRPAYRQIADTLAETIRSGQLRAGERLPSVREMSEGGVPTASARHALAVLTEEGLITSRQGRGAFVGEGGVGSGSARLRPRRPPATGSGTCAAAHGRPGSSPARRRAPARISSSPSADSGIPRRGPFSTTNTRSVRAVPGRSSCR